MQRMMAADSPRVSRIPSTHRARSFNGAARFRPGCNAADGIGDSPCAFSPVSADVPLALYGAGSFGPYGA